MNFTASVSAIPGGQAMKLKNSTERVPGLGQPRFLVGIDVFHQLHCLVSNSEGLAATMLVNELNLSYM